MEKNYTPLNLNKIGHSDKNDKTNMILLLIATLTTFVLVILLFLLIQKSLKENTLQNVPITPTPTPLILSPSPEPITVIPTIEPIASPSSQVITPTNTATASPILNE